MTGSATRTDIVISPLTMATDDGFCSAAEQKEAVRVTVEGGFCGRVCRLDYGVHREGDDGGGTRSVSKAQVHHQSKAPVWNDFLLLRIWGSEAEINNSTELFNEVEVGNLVIVRRDGTVANYSTMISLSIINPVPASTSLKHEEITAFKNAPRRYLETRGKC